jgi:chemotaxis protein MotB
MKKTKELTAPFYLLTYGDLMTLLMVFFILLFSMATVQEVKFESAVGAIKGSLGIMKENASAPIQKNMPSPSVRQTTRPVKKSSVKPTTLKSLSDYERVDLTEPVARNDDGSTITRIKQLGMDTGSYLNNSENEIILYLPSFGIFGRGQYKIHEDDPEVLKVKDLYTELAKQMGILIGYDIYFVGHTDAINLSPEMGPDVPKTNMELGFLRALALYDFFFKEYLTDKTRITFSSQGDNVPLIQNARLDSEKRKNRRVQIHLKKK